MFRQVARRQADADTYEAQAIARYRAVDPLRAYRAFGAVIEEACRLADAEARLDRALRCMPRIGGAA